MLDALELGRSIIEFDDLTKAIEAYEERMYEYSSKKARESYDNLKLCFSDDAAVKLTNLMNSYRQPD
ncbi:hypothetical protein GCM10025859_09010 [Alicyclobacillus fastidiosus]|nr:hypothetical protein GCM10025859_09010 [Alicyclobacillus fastidiosus]